MSSYGRLAILCWLVAVCTHGQVVQRVWPERIVVAPGHEARVAVEVANPGAVDVVIELVVRLRYGIDAEDVLPPSPIAIPAGRSTTTTVAFAIPPDRKWGHEVIATLANGSEAREFFTVGTNPWELGHYITIFMLRGRKESGDIDRTIERWRDSYVTAFEGFSWQPSVFDGMAPPELEIWRSGQGGYKESKEDWKYLIDQGHKQGIAAITYIQCFSYGPYGMDFARRHPEWLTFGADGRPAGAWFDVDKLSAYRDAPEDQGFDTPGGITTGRFLLTRPEVGDFWIDQVIASVDMFGWDGFRSDGMPGIDSGYDIAGNLVEAKDRDHNAEYLTKVRQRITERFPNFLYGWNNVAGGYPRMHNSAAEEAVMLKDAYSLYEHFRSAPDPKSDYHTWKKMVAHLQQEGDAVREGGGFPHAGWMASLHNLEAVASASGVQIDTWTVEPPSFANYRRFEFRWSEFLWDNKLRHLRPATDAVTVEAPASIWWQEFVQARDLPNGGRRMIVHMVNLPDNDNDAWTDQPGPEATNVTVKLLMPPGLKQNRLLVLSPDMEGDVVTVSIADDGTVTIPTVVRWTMLVAEYTK